MRDNILNLLDKILLLFITFLFSFKSFSLNDSIPANADSISGMSASSFSNKVLPPFLDSSYVAWADSVLDKMNLNEKIGQLFMVAAYSNRDEEHKKEITTLIKKYKIGGLIFMQGGPVRQANLTNDYQSISKIPLLIGMDAEWGLAMRLDSTIKYPEQMMLGAIQDNHLIYEMGRDIALQLKRLGVHINFAPVIDINNNYKNPVINSRSFGEDKYNVTSKGLAYMLALQDNNIIATGKHFPGHGDTDLDSHDNLPVIQKSFDEIDTIELYPYKELFKYGLGAVMVGHLNVPSIDPAKNIPATLSSITINNLLKEKLGFKGLIITDALNMQGAGNFANSGKLELEALKAGNDILLFPNNVPEAFDKIKKDIKKGKISVNEIDDHCRKILAVKKWLGLDEFEPINIKELYEDLNKKEYLILRQRLIESGITIVHNPESYIPIQKLKQFKIASLGIGSAKNNTFQNTLSLYSQIDCYNIEKDADTSVFYNLKATLDNYNLLIISIHKPSRNISKNFGIEENLINFLDGLAENKNAILCLFTNPYSLIKFKNTNKYKSIIVSYEDDELIQNFSAQLIFGGIPAQGLMPVSINDSIIAGKGYIIDSTIRFKYSSPEEAKVNAKILYKVDSIANDAIMNRVMPGCQVLCIKDEIVFYYKSFGYHTYLENKKVENSDIYDLASITKIAATLPALMKLTDEDKFNVSNKLSYYLPYLMNTNKKNLICSDILAHQAGLKPWIPFYVSLLEPLYKDFKLYDNKFSQDYPYQVSENMYLLKHYCFKEGYISHYPDSNYNIKITDQLYLTNQYKDSIFSKIDESELINGKKYKYSDLGFYYLYKVIENITNQKFNEYLEEEFYKPLGANTLGFLPVNHFEKDKIIPTENDLIFRKQLIHGFVHDPGAAMLGGVCGHAGLFGNANDLAKIMQLYLNNGVYGGERYINKKTIDFYTSCAFCYNGNRRG
ncbi:MAG: serine hydrolase, partial [Bacteroidales bacterium]|nr:serine hydrolase [Bacteroidales bacterium]